MRFGLIGCGAWGTQHARAIAKAPGAQLAAIAEQSEQNRASAKTAYPAAAMYANYREMLQQEKLEVVFPPPAPPRPPPPTVTVPPLPPPSRGAVVPVFQPPPSATMLPKLTFPPVPPGPPGTQQYLGSLDRFRLRGRK